MEAKVLQQEEAVRHIEDRLEKYTIRAYFDGYPSRRQAAGGVVRGNRPGWRISARISTPVTILGPGRLK